MSQVSIGDVRPKAQTALASSPIFELRDLQVEQEKSSLLISGSVSSFYHKQLAQEVVRAICKECKESEVEVINSIRVQP
jgi:hypothetical protein